ncbi:mll2610 [Mesorhizobium japonicum MAFF 303099]|uniref:Mll2610 protein n=1 Tax=Mesorhizobium japonicum (strain LMG 29417 / CECT 9101 / MAFF 303099) TaxID=266835 RepID=Q98I17_RHILO|nr:mll2610 [Mesorhizobium japonicum MAFF 303099]
MVVYALRQPEADIDGEAADNEMRQVGEEAGGELDVVEGAETVDEDAGIEAAGAGDQPEHAVEQIDRSEQLEIEHRLAMRDEGGGQRPDAGEGVQQVVIPLQREQAEQIAVGIVERRYVADGDDGEEQESIGNGKLLDQRHEVSPSNCRRTLADFAAGCSPNRKHRKNCAG